MQKAYRFAILYFLAFSLLLLLSSVLLFNEKIGFTYDGVLTYYLGNEATFILAKTPSGLLKIILPHIFGFGLFIMVVLHFVMFTKTNKKKIMPYLILTLFISGFVELFSPFLILYGLEFFAYIKLISFFIFEILFLYTFYLLFSSIINK